MRNVYRHVVLIIGIILLCVWAILPPGEKLRRAKDLAGGVSLVYQVELRSSDDSNQVVPQIIELLKQRVDPDGQLDISMVRQGSDRIEITMPLPSPQVLELRKEFERSLEDLGKGAISEDEAKVVLGLPAEQRAARLKDLAGGDAERLRLLEAAAGKFDAWQQARTAFNVGRKGLEDALAAAEKALSDARTASATPEEITRLTTARDAAATALYSGAMPAVDAEAAYKEALGAALATAISPDELRRVLELSGKGVVLPERGPDGKFIEIPSPRQQALAKVREAHPQAVARIDEVVKKFEAYASKRRSLDDPSDLQRMLKGAGVLEFRIAVSTDDLPPSRVNELREQLRKGGPKAVKASDVAWFKLNKLQGWYDSVAQFQALTGDPASYFAATRRYVAEAYEGEIYLLLYDVAGARLTHAEGTSWKVSSARATGDELGRPAISFSMDAIGAGEMRNLTSRNLQKPMAILLDDQVYTAANINSTISGSGIIQGQFTPEEVSYVVRVLGAGSLAAKLSPEPISRQTIGPELGADNLQRGLVAGVVAFVVVGGFIVVYYWAGGIIAVIGLGMNLLMILGAMALNHSAFSLPGIAGVILTFGMAVDANVLIFERMREELTNGHDLRTAVRLGYSKAFSAILDGNVTNLIVCVVLISTGTQEIKGFAITMTIGTVTTLIAQLWVTRVIYAILVEKLHWRKMSMLPLAVPAVQRAITPHIDWMKYRGYLWAVSALITVAAFYAVFARGEQILDNDFRGGTKITVSFKDGPDGQPLTLTRAQVQERVSKMTGMDNGPMLGEAREAEVLAINPAADGVTSSTFQIKTTVRESEAIAASVQTAFEDLLSVQRPLTFVHSDAPDVKAAPVLPITVSDLARVIGRPTQTVVPDSYVGGAAVVLENIAPGPVSLAQLEGRLAALRNDTALRPALSRPHQWVVLEGDDTNVKSAVFITSDPNLRYGDDPQRWESELRRDTWALVTTGLSRAQTLAGVESFSAAIARTFVAQAIVAVTLSTLMVVIYVWVRFNSLRYSLAAILSTLHDCVVAVGAIAIGAYIYDHFPGTAAALGLLPFKIDLNVVAAVLTLLGYSLNDTIVILDRIRENRGKLPYASRAMINLSINQTFSRTIMTGGSVIIATLVIYFMAGEAIRPFAFCFLVGVLTGTYSSVAVAAPLAWSRRLDPHANEPARSLAGASAQAT